VIMSAFCSVKMSISLFCMDCDAPILAGFGAFSRLELQFAHDIACLVDIVNLLP
jgi:hypothetical protein